MLHLHSRSAEEVDRREIPVILTSGYPGDSMNEMDLDGRVRMLSKPYRQSELAMAIADVSSSRRR